MRCALTLAQVFKTWHEEVECDMLAWRDKRMRQYYEDRYDYRKNLIDWDYSMNVKEWAEIIHSKVTVRLGASVRVCAHTRMVAVPVGVGVGVGVDLGMGDMRV